MIIDEALYHELDGGKSFDKAGIYLTSVIVNIGTFSHRHDLCSHCNLVLVRSFELDLQVSDVFLQLLLNMEYSII